MIKSKRQLDIGNLVDLSDSAVLPPQPAVVLAEPRKPPHEAGCACIECWDAGLRYAEYLQAKSAQDWWEGS